MQQPFTPAQNMRSSGVYSRDISEIDMSSLMGSVKSSGGLHVSFFHKRVTIENADAEQNGNVQTRLCIAKQPKGDRSTVATNFITVEEARAQFPHEYHHFSEHQEMPTSGTPLSELPGISMSQIGLLTLNGLRSIEDLLEVSKDQIDQIGLDAVRAQKVAQAWSSRRNDNSDTISAADMEARYQIERETTEKQLLQMQEQNKVLAAQVEALQSAKGITAPAGGVVHSRDTGEGLEYDLDNVDDPMSEGPAVVGDDGNMDLASEDIDPLAGD